MGAKELELTHCIVLNVSGCPAVTSYQQNEKAVKEITRRQTIQNLIVILTQTPQIESWGSCKEGHPQNTKKKMSPNNAKKKERNDIAQ